MNEEIFFGKNFRNLFMNEILIDRPLTACSDARQQNVKLFEPLPRVNQAIHFAIDHPQGTSAGKKVSIMSERQMDALCEVEHDALRSDSKLRLSDLQPAASAIEMEDRLSRMSIISINNPAYNKLITQARIQPKAYWESGDGAAVLEEADKEIYKRIEQVYDVKDGEMYFHLSMKEVHTIIKRLLRNRLEEYATTIGPINEEIFAVGPSKLVQMALSPTSAPDLQTDSMRALVLGELTARIDYRSRGVARNVAKLQGLLDLDVFNNGQLVGEGDIHEFYGFFDKRTNDLLWISDIHEKLTQQQYAELITHAHLKKLAYRMRDAGEGVGPVMTDPRTKESAVEKVIRDADKRDEMTGDDFLEPSDINDLVGIMFVTKYQTALAMRDKVESVLINRMGLEANAIVRRDKNGDNIVEPEKSRKVRYYRTEAKFPNGMRSDGNLIDTAPIEIICMSMEDYMNYNFQIAEFDARKNRFIQGQAHQVFEASRAGRVERRIFPHKPINYDVVTAKAVTRAKKYLRQFGRVSIEHLPQRYIENEE